MSTLNGDCCTQLMQGALVRPIARYPASIAGDDPLKVASNRVRTSLVRSVHSGDTLITVSDASRIVPQMLLSVDSEIVSVSAIDGNILTVIRGFDGTQPCSHPAGAPLDANIVAWHHNVLAAEVEAIEQALGPNLSNIGGGGTAFVIASNYDFTPQVPGGNLVVGANVITLNPVPRGVNGTDRHHWLWIDQGTGTPEACEIIGGTAVSGAASGTVIVNCASAHSGAWRVSSATAGIEEALVVSRYVAENRMVTTIHAPIWVDSAHELYGAPIWGTEIKQASANTDCVWIGDNSSQNTVTAVISGLIFSTTSAPWTSGWAINLRYAGFSFIRDCYIYGDGKIWGGINLYRAIQVNLWNNFIKGTRSHGISIAGEAPQPNFSITCNVIRCETADIGGNPIRIGDYTMGLEFRDCILNGCVKDGIRFEPAAAAGEGSNSNYFISECDIEGAGVYADNVSNLQVVNNWLSGNPPYSPFKATSTTDAVLFSDNLITGSGVAGAPPLVDIDGNHTLVSGNHINGAGEVPALVSVGPNAKNTQVTGNLLMTADKGVQINAAAQDTLVTGNTFTSCNTPISGKGIRRYVTGNKGIDEVMPAGALVAAATISPVNPVQLVQGTTPINTITLPDNFSGPLTLLPIHAFTWTAAGNIFAAGTAVPGKALTLVYDTIDAKWWPSYT